jgi:hypothetical protein
LIKTLEERFWSKVDTSGECWFWRGGVGKKGYGNFSVDGKTVSAHRAAYVIQHGKEPENDVCHTCDNPLCMRGAHLFDGTKKDNNDDKMRKGRHKHGPGPVGLYGEDNPRSRFDNQTVEMIKQLLASGQSQQKVAEVFGTSQSHVSRIKRGEVWSVGEAKG